MLSSCFLKQESIENIQLIYKYDWRRHESRIQNEKKKKYKKQIIILLKK